MVIWRWVAALLLVVSVWLSPDWTTRHDMTRWTNKLTTQWTFNSDYIPTSRERLTGWLGGLFRTLNLEGFSSERGSLSFNLLIFLSPKNFFFLSIRTTKYLDYSWKHFSSSNHPVHKMKWEYVVNWNRCRSSRGKRRTGRRRMNVLSICNRRGECSNSSKTT